MSSFPSSCTLSCDDGRAGGCEGGSDVGGGSTGFVGNSGVGSPTGGGPCCQGGSPPGGPAQGRGGGPVKRTMNGKHYSQRPLLRVDLTVWMKRRPGGWGMLLFPWQERWFVRLLLFLPWV